MLFLFDAEAFILSQIHVQHKTQQELLIDVAPLIQKSDVTHSIAYNTLH